MSQRQQEGRQADSKKNCPQEPVSSRFPTTGRNLGLLCRVPLGSEQLDRPRGSRLPCHAGVAASGWVTFGFLETPPPAYLHLPVVELFVEETFWTVAAMRTSSSSSGGREPAMPAPGRAHRVHCPGECPGQVPGQNSRELLARAPCWQCVELCAVSETRGHWEAPLSSLPLPHHHIFLHLDL